MLYGSEKWCLVQNEIGILQRTERAMVRSMCGVKLVDKMLTEDIIQMLDVNEKRIISWQKLIEPIGIDLYEERIKTPFLEGNKILKQKGQGKWVDQTKPG